MKKNYLFLLVLLLSFSFQTTWSQTPIENELYKIQPEDTENYGNFGSSVAVDGNRAVIGRPWIYNSNTSSYGAVYVYEYENDNWVEKAVLTADDESNDYYYYYYGFGSTVALEGNTIVAYREYGGFYIFELENETWTQKAHMEDPLNDGYNDYYFGSSLAISGDYIAASQEYYYDNDDGTYKGYVHMYKKTNGTWDYNTSIEASDHDGSNYNSNVFGSSVAMDGNQLVVGANNADTPEGNDKGAVYVFELENQTWTEKAKLYASNFANENEGSFGYDVDIDGDNVIVGSYRTQDENNINNYNGEAFIFNNNNGTWTEVARIAAIDSENEDYSNNYFGYSVAIENNLVVVGSYNDNHSNLTSPGSVYLYENQNGTWTETSKYTASDASDYAYLGWEVDISGNTIYGGATNAQDNNNNNNRYVGAVYVFGASPSPADSTPPVITLLGDNPQSINLGEAYEELGATATDDVDGEIASENIAIDADEVDTESIGTYTVTYTVTDAAGNTGTATRQVEVVDGTDPVITLLGDNPQVLWVGADYEELGATATDNVDGDFAAEDITINTDDVDTSTVGSYAVTYSVTDAAGNTATESRTVNVIQPVLTATDDEAAAFQKGDAISIFVLNNDSFGEYGPIEGHALRLQNGRSTRYTRNGAKVEVDDNGTPDIETDDFIVYTPDEDFSGVDTFEYRITNSEGLNEKAIVSVTVRGSTRVYNPEAGEDTATADQNGDPINIFILDNDDFGGFGPNQDHGVRLLSGRRTGHTGEGAELAVNDNGTPEDVSDDYIVYTPDEDFSGEDVFFYRLTDAKGNGTKGKVTVTVNPTDDDDDSSDDDDNDDNDGDDDSADSEPVAVDDNVSVNASEQTLRIYVLDNDDFGTNGPNEDHHLRLINGKRQHASENGAKISYQDNDTPDDKFDDYILYTLEEDFTGEDTFVYVITDSEGEAATGTVTVNVVAQKKEVKDTAIRPTADLTFDVYPNPVQDLLRINTNAQVENVQIINPLGKVIFNQSNTREISVSNLASGMYLIRASVNNEIITKRFIKR